MIVFRVISFFPSMSLNEYILKDLSKNDHAKQME